MKNNSEIAQPNQHALVAGWFSFNNMGATAGDLIACQLVCEWLKEAGLTYEIAAATLFHLSGSVNWQEVDPLRYTEVVFVCGPAGNGPPLTDFLNRFSHARLVGVNLSMLQPLEAWNPFDILLERDSTTTVNPDLTFYSPFTPVPVVGVILVHKQKEYGKRALHDEAHDAITRLLGHLKVAVVHIDTALQQNKGGLTSPAAIETLISRMDVVITTRLHGTVLALKHGVPVIPIDPIAGGAKISSQVMAIEWPVLFNAEHLDDEALLAAFTYCLTPGARLRSKECVRKARSHIEQIHQTFLEQIADKSVKTSIPST